MKQTRIPELDGLRALMIFLVSWYHIWQQSWLTPYLGQYSLDYLMRSGYVWVDGTVLLSSFLLFLPYARRSLNGEPSPDTKDFYFRRAKRILPSYYFILLLILFSVAVPYGLYYSPQFLVKDLAAHLTFLHTFSYETYVLTPLGAACWTIAVEVQAYLIFPLLARAAVRKPALTLCLMVTVCFAFRLWCLWALSDFTMVVNQLINFLDIYALGMLLAFLFVRVRLKVENKAAEAGKNAAVKKQLLLIRVSAACLFLLALFLLLRMLRLQAASSANAAGYGLAGRFMQLLQGGTSMSNYAVIQRNQMLYRPVFGLLFGALLFSAPFSVRPLRFLLGNRFSRFLAGISMNYYLMHQTVITHMRRIGFPQSVSDTPNQVGEQPWQFRYTLFAFGISFLLAVAVTYLIEKPAGKYLERYRIKK